MRFRIVDAALVVATIVGAVAAAISSRQLHSLQHEDKRLTGALGELVITDPTELHIQAIDTGEPLHLAWRVYAPAGRITMFDFDSSGGNVCRTFDDSLQPREFIGRIRFTEQRPERAGVYRHFNERSAFCSLTPEMFQFLREHWSELEIEQLGVDEVARLKSGESTTVLRVSLPPSLIDTAREELSRPYLRQPAPAVFECRLQLD